MHSLRILSYDRSISSSEASSTHSAIWCFVFQFTVYSLLKTYELFAHKDMQYSDSDVYWTVRHLDNWKIKNQLDATYYFIVLLIGSTCFGHYYAHHQEFATMTLITTLVVSFCKDGGGSFNVKLWFLVVCVRCEVLCCLVAVGNVFLLILIVVILYVWWS